MLRRAVNDYRYGEEVSVGMAERRRSEEIMKGRTAAILAKGLELGYTKEESVVVFPILFVRRLTRSLLVSKRSTT